MAIKFEPKTPDIVVAFIKKRRWNIYGRPFYATEACRAIRESGGWRIDRCAAIAGTWSPWESIDAVPYPTLPAAKAAIREYAGQQPAESGGGRSRFGG